MYKHRVQPHTGSPKARVSAWVYLLLSAAAIAVAYALLAALRGKKRGPAVGEKVIDVGSQKREVEPVTEPRSATATGNPSATLTGSRASQRTAPLHPNSGSLLVGTGTSGNGRPPNGNLIRSGNQQHRQYSKEIPNIYYAASEGGSSHSSGTLFYSGNLDPNTLSTHHQSTNGLSNRRTGGQNAGYNLRPRYMGLRNNSVQCYAISVIQMIYSEPRLLQLVRTMGTVKGAPESLDRLAQIYKRYLDKAASNTSLPNSSAIQVFDLMSSRNSCMLGVAEMDVNTQHDPVELIESLFEAIIENGGEEAANLIQFRRSRRYPDFSGGLTWTPPAWLTVNDEVGFVASLVVKPIHDIMKISTSGLDPVDLQDAVRREYCEKRYDDGSTLTMTRLPEIAHIGCQRYISSGSFLPQIPVTTRIQFPRVLELDEMDMATSQRVTRNYDLRSIIVGDIGQSDSGSTYGHYQAYGYRNGDWWNLNDSVVSLQDEATVLGDNNQRRVSVLQYVRQA